MLHIAPSHVVTAPALHSIGPMRPIVPRVSSNSHPLMKFIKHSKMVHARVSDKVFSFKLAQYEGRILSRLRRKVVAKHCVLSTIQQACELCHSSPASLLPILWRAEIALLKSYFHPISPQAQPHFTISINPDSTRTPTATAAANYLLRA